MPKSDVMLQAFALADCIEKEPLVLALKKAENDLENDPEIAVLAYAFDLVQTRYNDCLKIYPETSLEAQKSQKDLYLKKKALDEHPLTQAYLHCYSKVRVMYEEMQSALFAPFNEHQCEKGE